MVEPYQWLVAHAQELGFPSENCGPASVDLCLGDVKVWMGTQTGFSLVSPAFGSVIYRPGQFYLCSTEEYIRVPSTHCAYVNMRSSYARKGLGHKMAGFIDPGFEGQITLELETAIPLVVRKGDRIVQLIYHRLSEETVKPYKGHYTGQTGATESY